MNILSVKACSNGYLVNKETFVPNDLANAHYLKVQQWIASGNTVEDEFTEAEQLEQKKTSANVECTRRINAKWDQIGQINASLGVYSKEESAACADWIAQNRGALMNLLKREDLVRLDISDDQHWPV
ncbi:hypothetical protein [Marinomonas spartinae]|uniref:hypothetical protein n=1 Tax=Marinomonas spartinae TaxID=1792290 RepID=UPI0018F1C7FF|nr:hypothetical protein [Marinomonas spartinae]MBJ7553158.1 hypothetical protein [Marinomonas spartinae]